MKRLRVQYQDSAADDLQDIYLFVVSRGASAGTARAYVDRIRAACRRIGHAPEGGRPRDDLAPGLRTWAFERRAVIAYRIEHDGVVVERVFYGGRDIDGLYAPRSRHGKGPN